MVELRKRKAPIETVTPPVKKINSVKSRACGKQDELSTNGSPLNCKIVSGDTIDLEGFGGEIESHDGLKTNLKKLVDESKAGVILFTYPKASTPGCTTQACLFRDEFTPLTATGFSIYGLSLDSPKSNLNFKTKQNLPYTLLCDPSATLITAIGMRKTPSGTLRGVFVINKEGKVEAVSAGGPAATVDVARKLVGGKSSISVGTGDGGHVTEGEKVETEEEQRGPVNMDEVKAQVAAEVADTAQKLDYDAGI